MFRASVNDAAVAAPGVLEFTRVDVGEAELGERVRIVRGKGERPLVRLHCIARPAGVEQRPTEADPELEIFGEPFDELIEFGYRGLGLSRTPERIAEIEAGVDVAGIELEGDPIGGYRFAGPFLLEEQIAERGVGGGFIGLAGDRPPREIEGKPDPAGRTRKQSVVQCHTGESRSGREHLPIPGLGRDELPGPMRQDGLAEPFGEAGGHLGPQADRVARSRSLPLARFRSGGFASHRIDLRRACAKPFPIRMVSDAPLRMAHPQVVIIIGRWKNAEPALGPGTTGRRARRNAGAARCTRRRAGSFRGCRTNP